MAAAQDECRIRGIVTEAMVEGIGDDEFLQDENWQDIDLFAEYDLGNDEFVEIVSIMSRRFGIVLSPIEIEREDISSVSKATATVRARL